MYPTMNIHSYVGFIPKKSTKSKIIKLILVILWHDTNVYETNYRQVLRVFAFMYVMEPKSSTNHTLPKKKATKANDLPQNQTKPNHKKYQKLESSEFFNCSALLLCAVWFLPIDLSLSQLLSFLTVTPPILLERGGSEQLWGTQVPAKVSPKQNPDRKGQKGCPIVAG